jgi:MFS transporter, ACS family, tartrate transporter
MSSQSAAAGLAAIGAIANLIGGAVMVNAYGIIDEKTGSHTLALLPLAALCLAGGIAVVLMGRNLSQGQKAEGRLSSHSS